MWIMIKLVLTRSKHASPYRFRTYALSLSNGFAHSENDFVRSDILLVTLICELVMTSPQFQQHNTLMNCIDS